MESQSDPNPSDVISRDGVSASSHPWATAAGLEMLLRGGNAVDAATATGFALAVCEPAWSHLGGQGIMLVRMADERETVALDFYACAPGAARQGMYRWIESPTQGEYRFWTEDDLNTTGGLSVCVPGTVCGWLYAHGRWGRLPRATVLGPAIVYAARGVPLTSRLAAAVAENRDRLRRSPAAAAVFLRPDGTPRPPGELIVQADLARTLELLAEHGSEPFYAGEIAEAIVACVRADRGVLAGDDLARYPTELFRVHAPDAVGFRQHTIQCAPPQASALLLHLLLLLDGIDLSRYRPLAAEKLHLLVEAMKLAFADRSRHIGDDTCVNMPLAGLLNPSYAAARRALIDPGRALFPGAGDPWAFQSAPPDPAKMTVGVASPAGDGGCTSHHSHVDRWGNFVALTQSLGDQFGSALMVPGYGVLLNNAMKLFDPRPGARAASIAPYKRPLSPWPTLVLRDGVPVMALGSPSGTRIPNAIAQVLVNVLDHGLGLQAAVDCPRVHWSGHELEAESDLPGDARDGLARLGHVVQYRHRRSPWFGAVQAVARDPDTGMCRGG
ncbi:MAG TPA: gamma-glutamyltransferase, partial [bacterium]|nr:gamma-glutamyltransferase [bacterium]